MQLLDEGQSQPDAMSESAFAVNVLEAESMVSRLRELHDPSASLGAPAHVTILYPFMPPDEITTGVLERARAALRDIHPFSFRLETVARFPEVLYLAPDPPTPFVGLTRALVAEFPDYPPYGGRHATIVPHLTVAQTEEHVLDGVEVQLRAAMPPDGIVATCRQLVLMENSSGLWKPMHTFHLGEAGAERR